MNYWIIPSNPLVYKLEEVLRERKVIDWRQHNRFQVGDIVYIYISKTYRQLIYKMEVIGVDIAADETISEKRFWVNPLDYSISINNNRFFRMKAISENLSEQLTYDDLFEHGLRCQLQGAVKIKEPLLSYIQSVF